MSSDDAVIGRPGAPPPPGSLAVAGAEDAAAGASAGPASGADSAPEAWRRRRRRALSLACASMVVVAVAAVGLGSVAIPPGAVLAILASRLPGVDLAGAYPDAWGRIVWELRLPRVLLAALVGSGLSVSGTVYQALLRNPLAEPFLLGVSSGAGALAVLVISVGAGSWLGSQAVPVAAFAGALAASAFIVLLARVRGRLPVANLILAGVALSAFLSALTAFTLFRSQGTFRVLEILGWLMGTLTLASWSRILMAAPYIVVPVLVAVALGRVMNVMLLGEEQAHHLGLPVERVKLLLVALGAVLAAGSVAGAGIVGFVGLIVPHTVRLTLGADHRILVPVAAVLGGTFLILCDLVARTMFSPTEIPVGVVTALFGAPFFLYLLRRRQGLEIR